MFLILRSKSVKGNATLPRIRQFQCHTTICYTGFEAAMLSYCEISPSPCTIECNGCLMATLRRILEANFT